MFKLLHLFILGAFLLAVSACSVSNSDDAKDPVVVEQPVAYIKRALTDEDGERLISNLNRPSQFRPGAVLYLKERAAPGANARDISSAAFSDPAFLNADGQLLYDVKDLHVSFDGTKLLFAMRAPDIENADDEDQPKWNIWEYAMLSASLRRIISSDITAEDGHDIAPAYLADGRIVFSSTRQRYNKALLLDEDKTQFSGLDEDLNEETFVLHIMNDDGSGIQQLTFNHSHDLSPLVLNNGKILFSRWDNAGQTPANGFNLYQINPDGTGLSYVYGRHSHDSAGPGRQVHFAFPQALENGNIAVQLRTFSDQNVASLPLEIDIAQFVEHDVRTDATLVDLETEAGAQVSIIRGMTASTSQSLKGRYGAFFPLNDGSNRYLVSWSVCRVQLIDTQPAVEGNQSGSPEVCTQAKLDSEDYEAADPLYGLWLYDASQDTQLPIDLAESGRVFEEAVLLTARTRPDFIPPATLSQREQALADASLGVLNIQSVYDFDGIDSSSQGIAVLADPAQTQAPDRPLRFVRIEKPVAIPDETVRDIDNTAYGRSRAQLMREILGYVPVEPDGSVKVAVPANVPFAISVLNAQGKRVTQRHQNWLHLAPGETLSCIGCHTANSEVPHGRLDAQPDSANPGSPTTGQPFPNTHPALFADMGETMAETYSRINGVRKLSPDIVFVDEWTDSTDQNASPSASFSYAYSDLQTSIPVRSTPSNPDCLNDWTFICRIVINYEQHIHPLWSVDRQVFDVDEVTLLDDFTCTACHSNTDENDDLRVPDGQLDLSNGPSTDEADHFKSYRELLFNDNEVELLGGVLVDRLEDSGEVNLVPQLDGEGNPVLDENGDPVILEVPILVTVNVPASMNVAGALNSGRFMSKFEAGGTHEAYLTPAELKLIAEWLDLGAQYFNNPFDAPAN